MYVFGIDIPLNVMMGIALVLHLIELLLVLAILRKLKRRVRGALKGGEEE